MVSRQVVVDVVRLDPRDDDQWADYHRVTAAAHLHQRRYADFGDAESFRVPFVRPSADSASVGWTGRVGGDVVGVAMAVFPLADNTHLASTEVNVAPTWRRCGVGTALLAAIDAELPARGRRTDQAEVARPYDDGAGGVAGVKFARAHGYERAQTEVHYVLSSPLPPSLLAGLEREAGEHAGAYRILTWEDRCPNEWVAAVCALEEAFLTHAPTGDLDVEPEVWSEQRLREGEKQWVARGRRTLVSVAVAPDGSLAGNSELVMSTRMLRNGVSQSGTLVLPAHQGHRLGLALKVANHARLQADEPAPRLVHTYNAVDNAPMIAVNARLGYRPVEYSDTWQRARG